MPKAIPMSKRLLIIEGRESKKTIQALSIEYEVDYSTVKRLLRRHKASPEAAPLPRYNNCGKRKRDAKTDIVYRGVRCFKRWHPTWGAGKIRTELLRYDNTLVIPSDRTLQQWFKDFGQTRRRRDVVPSVESSKGKAAHDVWQIDAKEEMKTLDGQLNTWLNIKDEYTGAVVEPTVFPL